MNGVIRDQGVSLKPRSLESKRGVKATIFHPYSSLKLMGRRYKQEMYTKLGWRAIEDLAYLSEDVTIMSKDLIEN
jgi:hypothetical protein